MKIRTIRGLWAALFSAAIGAVPVAEGAALGDVFGAAEQVERQARASEAKVDSTAEATRDLLAQYRTVVKETEGLQIYNRQLDKQIASQDKEMANLAGAIDRVTVIERQIMPLMMRMIDSLAQFVSLDLPFLLKERQARIANLREIIGRADVTSSEKFSQVLRAYQIENEYGRTLEAYTDEIQTANGKLIVDVLKAGRIALVYQSSDGEQTGAWNVAKHAWEPLPDSYTNNIRNGIRMARKQLSVDLLTLPIAGPEPAQ